MSDLLKRKLEQLAVRWDYHIATGQLWLLALTFRPHVTFLHENGTFSSCLAYCNWVSGKRKGHHNELQSRDFWKHWLSVYLWADENRGFSTSIRFMNHLHTTTPNYSIVFPSFFCVLCWRAKTIPIRNVWSSIFSQLRRRKKISFFRKIRIHVDTLNVTSYFIKSKKNTFSWNDVKRDKYCQTFLFPIFFPRKSLPSLRKQPPFHDVTTGFPAKWRLRNERTNSILMTRHYPDLGSLPLIGWSKCPMRHDQSEALPRSG